MLDFVRSEEGLNETIFIKVHHCEVNSVLSVKTIGVEFIKYEVVFLVLFLFLSDLLRSIP